MFELDCKLLSIFFYVYKFKSVSLAADHLEMSQPTVSNILNKIRIVFESSTTKIVRAC